MAAQSAEKIRRRLRDTFVGSVSVECCEPVHDAAFGWEPTEPRSGEVITFTGTASGTGPITYTWDLGDGAVGAGASVAHTYTAGGDYLVTMTATNGWGGAIVTHAVGVRDAVHDAAFSWSPATPMVSDTVTFTATAAGDEPITYTWDLGDGATDSGAHVTHAYSAAGDYAIVLTVTNCGGSTDVVADVITVVPPCDRVEIVTVTTSITGCVVTFEAGVEGAAPFDYLWDFGALGTSTETRPTVDSVISGTYAYTLTVVNCGGAGQDTWSDSVVVECAPSYRIYLPLVTRQS